MRDGFSYQGDLMREPWGVSHSNRLIKAWLDMYIAIAFIPLACFIFLCHLAHRRGADYCGALLAGAVGWGVIITALTELLSALSALTFWGVLTAWLIVTCVLAATSQGITFGARQVFTDIWKRFLNTEPFRAPAALCRRWSVGHRSVRRAILRAIELGFDDLSSRPSRPLGAEQFGGALPSRKPLATLSAALGRVRAFTFRVAERGRSVCICGSVDELRSLLSGCLVDRRSVRGQRARPANGSRVCTTLPAAVLQASSTQNNLVVALWLICFVRFLLDFRVTKPGNRLIIGLGCGAALGLAMLTKGTAYPLAAALVIWFAVLALRYRSQGGMLAASAAIVIALSLNVTHWSRNYQTFSSPLGPKDELSTYQPEDHVAGSVCIQFDPQSCGAFHIP